MTDKISKMIQELSNRLQYFYLKTDGSYDFPNSADGDLLRMTNKLLKELQEEHVVEEIQLIENETNEFKDGDIIAIYISSSCCVLSEGYYQGTVIERKGELVVVLNDIGLVMKNEADGAPGFRSLENVESNSDWTKLLHREGE